MAKAAHKDLSDNNSKSPDVEDASKQRNQISETALTFRNLWNMTTDDNPLTLYGFRRFRTTHLLNLRLLETEIETYNIDHKIYQAGLGLGLPLASADKLGLKHSKRDEHAPRPEDILKRHDRQLQCMIWGSSGWSKELVDWLQKEYFSYSSTYHIT